MALFILLSLVVSSVMFLTFNKCMNSNSNVCMFLFDKSLRNKKIKMINMKTLLLLFPIYIILSLLSINYTMTIKTFVTIIIHQKLFIMLHMTTGLNI